MRKYQYIIIVFVLFLCKSAIFADVNKLQEAWHDIDFLDFRRATIDFTEVLKTAEDNSREWQEATLGLAVSLHQRQPDTPDDKKRAAHLYETLLASSADDVIKSSALLLRGKLEQFIDYYGDKENFKAAISYYEQVLKKYPDSTSADQAALYMSQCLVYSMDKKQAKKGIRELKKWIKDHPDNPFAATQWLFISLAYRVPLDDISKSIDAAIKAVEIGLPEGSGVDIVLWRIAEMAQKIGKKDIANKYYTKIIKELPRSRYVYMAQQRIIKMGFEAPELIDPFK